MASNFVVGFGSSISYSPTSGGSFTPVAQTIDLSTPMAEVGDIKITNNSSPNNSHEYAPGLVEPGEIEFEVVYYKTGHQTLLNLVGNGISYFWKETFTDNPASICSFQGYLKGAGIEGKTEDDALKGKIKIKLTSAAVYS